MRRLALISLTTAFHLLFLQSITAEVKLPVLISSNMVLQRNTNVVLWGWADSKENITIKASWLDESINLEADNEGSWRIEVKTTSSKEAQTINIRSRTSDITLDNVLFGEVWLCSGQSNMQLPIKGWNGEPVFGSLMTIAKSDNPDLRLFAIDMQGSKTPLQDIEKYTAWEPASPTSVPDFSAVAYYFGEQLQEILDCPVGLIHSSYSGSSVQTWMSNEVVSSYQEVNLDDVELTIQSCRHAPTVLFNAMINPIIPYKIKGALWYQGEENRREPENYKILFPAMVKDWRTRWGIGDFPFYFVQIAPFLYGDDNDEFMAIKDNTAFIREAQLQCLELIPNSGMAITLDIGDDYSIHPPNKKEVADRLLFIALNQTYGYKSVDCASPVYDSYEAKDGGIILKFKNAEDGLYSFHELEGFEIAGDDKVFYPAHARIGIVKDGVERNEVFVKSDKVPEPVAVRYAWHNYIVGTLYDTHLLPASSFRTDDWDEATRFGK